jgi:hypothetical protein
MKRVAAGAIGLTLAAGFYLLLIDTVDIPELYAGAAVVVLAAIAFEAAREEGFAESRPDPAWLARSWRALIRVPTQVVTVSLEAFLQLAQRRRERGAFRAVPFATDRHGAREAGRRSLAEALGSLAPNTIVVGIDPNRELLLVHQLRVSGDRGEIDVLGLG